jgi:hypothetical protein
MLMCVLMCAYMCREWRCSLSWVSCEDGSPCGRGSGRAGPRHRQDRLLWPHGIWREREKERKREKTFLCLSLLIRIFLCCLFIPQVNKSARVASVAKGGQIVVSKEFLDIAEFDRSEYQLKDLGKFELKVNPFLLYLSSYSFSLLNHFPLS